MNKILTKVLFFLPYPLVTCPKCGHRGTPVAMKCEKCGEDIGHLYL